jgi:hypothetical protein
LYPGDEIPNPIDPAKMSPIVPEAPIFIPIPVPFGPLLPFLIPALL